MNKHTAASSTTIGRKPKHDAARPVTVYLPCDLADRVVARAREQHRTISGQVTHELLAQEAATGNITTT